MLLLHEQYERQLIWQKKAEGDTQPAAKSIQIRHQKQYFSDNGTESIKDR